MNLRFPDKPEKDAQKLLTKEIYDKEKAIWDKLMIEVPKMGKKVPDTKNQLTIQIDNSDLFITMPELDWKVASDLIGQPINKIDLRVIEIETYIGRNWRTLKGKVFSGLPNGARLRLMCVAVRPSEFVEKLRELLKQQ